MRHIFRQLLGMVAGAAVLAVVLTATGVFAQDNPDAAGAAPVAVQGTLSQHDVIQYQGQLFNPANGQPLANTAVNGSFRIYGQASGGTPLWQEDKVVNTNMDGLFNTLLGSVNPLNLSIFDGRELYLGVAVNGEEGGPRLPITFVPYAFWSRNADKLDGLGSEEFLRNIAHGIVDENGNRVNGSNFSSRWVNDNGDEYYEISISGHTYNLNDYVTVVTPITQNTDACRNGSIAGTNSFDGKLIVEVFDRGGGQARCKFHFTVTRP